MDTNTLVSKLQQARTLMDECLRSVTANDDPAVELTSIETSSGSKDIDFSVPIRPFRKEFAGLSGGRKFTLLLAWLVKGDLKKEIALAAIISEWDNMSGMLNAKFNRKFSSDAREADWVTTVKDGIYVLRPNWAEVLNPQR
jgi:hypothetical protein